MTRLLFRNRWIALLWAASVLVSMAVFVSEDGGSAQVEAAAEKIRTQRAGPSPDAMQAPDAGSFTPDEELFVEEGATAPDSAAEPQVRLVRSSAESDAPDHQQDPAAE